MDENLPALTDVLLPAPKRRGRKPGGGKVPGSGRKPGGKNKVPRDLRETILARGKPLELLCDISRGVKVRVGPQAGPGEPQYAYPTLQERASAAKILIDKLMPAAATDRDPAPPSAALDLPTDIEIARSIAFTLSQAAQVKLPAGSPRPETFDGMKRVASGEPWSPDEPAEVEARDNKYRSPNAIPAGSDLPNHIAERREEQQRAFEAAQALTPQQRQDQTDELRASQRDERGSSSGSTVVKLRRD